VHRKNNLRIGHMTLGLINALSVLFRLRKMQVVVICHALSVVIGGAGCVDYL
jgi:hypothetical protein